MPYRTTKHAVPYAALPSTLQKNWPWWILWPVLSDLHTANEFSVTRRKAAWNIYFYPQFQHLACLLKLQVTVTEISHNTGGHGWHDGLLEHNANWVWTPLMHHVSADTYNGLQISQTQIWKGRKPWKTCVHFHAKIQIVTSVWTSLSLINWQRTWARRVWRLHFHGRWM